MTPAARVQASIEILDDILAGSPVEKALTGWARRSRFAGSKDRAAVRDHVFDAIRCKRSFAARGGSETGRGLMIGALRAAGRDLAEVFTGDRHAPAKVLDTERSKPFASDAERLDIPGWLWPQFAASLNDAAEAVAHSLQSRAPVHLRVNLAKSTRPQAISALAADGIGAETHPACSTALNVTGGARKIAQCTAYLTGLVELQDAASQAVIEAISLRPGLRVLDYCAGGGGKSLALAARSEGVQVFAHDANQSRMKDLPARAERAGADIRVLSTAQVAQQEPFDVVLTDVPCSGSGSWRRAPAGKWALTQDRLAALLGTQNEVLESAAAFLKTDGVLVYATCSVLKAENDGVTDAFLKAHPNWHRSYRNAWLVSHETDGFFTIHLTRKGLIEIN